MRKDYEPLKLNLDRDASEPQEFKEEGITFAKGETLGWFEMGSTIVLIFEAPPETQLHIREGQKLRLGEEIVTTSRSTQAA
jgi:phosphatidylserine decarboxylase